MPNITAEKHPLTANAGVGSSSITGRYVVLSHAVTAAPVDFRISIWSSRPPTFGEGRSILDRRAHDTFPVLR